MSTVTERAPAEAERVHAERTGRAVGAGAFRPSQFWESLPEALRKLDPGVQLRNPVMFVVWIGSLVVTVSAIVDPSVFAWLVAVWLWFTVLFANLAEAVAEGRGRAQAESLRRTRTDTPARRLLDDGREEEVAATALRIGDRVVVSAGEVIPGDGEIVEGIATVDESAITGESAPVVRESGGDFSSVTGGTTVLSDRIVVRVTTKPGESFVDRMIALVEGAQRQKTPNEIALTILLAALTIVFLLAVVALQPMAGYSGQQQSLVVLVALLVCLIPTTIGALLSAIGIAGMDRLVQRNVLATSGRAVEAAGDVSTLLLDKTGTITYGNRRATRLHPLRGVDAADSGRRGPPVEPGRHHAGGPVGGRALPRGVRPGAGGDRRRGRRRVRAVLRPDPHVRDRHRRPRGPQGGRLRGAGLGRRVRRGGRAARDRE